jgi:hypothetical protein
MNRQQYFMQIINQKIWRAALVCAFVFAGCVAAQAQIYPHFDCSEPIAYNDSGAVTQYRSWFGYENAGSDAVSINDGSNNFFSPNPGGIYSGQQTTVFQPGYQRRSFSIIITPGSTVTWIVQNRPAATSLNPARFCGNGTNLVTYQGKLTVAGAAANQPHDFEFRFFDVPTGGDETSPRLYSANVAVTNGIFTTQLDANQIFRKGVSEGKWLQIGVRRAGTTDAYEQLLPRQQLTAAPFAVNATNVSGGFVQLPINQDTTAEKCNDATRGQISLAGSSLLRVCTTIGWKQITLQ